ncbi:MAG TPA: hypothetical protein VGR71_02845 [Nitrospira sp.]|nr:hypothetical protein [Nitrospira sp.]
MRAVLGFMLVLVFAVPAFAAWIADYDSRLIVPGQRIGSVHLGMHRAMIDAINRTSLCPVLAMYDEAGNSTWLETNWGGGCLLSNEIQVGLPFDPVARAFGRPDRIAQDTRYPHAVAVWTVYEGRGIAFRVLGWHSSTTIQAIAVFPRLRRRLLARIEQRLLIASRSADRPPP